MGKGEYPGTPVGSVTEYLNSDKTNFPNLSMTGLVCSDITKSSRSVKCDGDRGCWWSEWPAG